MLAHLLPNNLPMHAPMRMAEDYLTSLLPVDDVRHARTLAALVAVVCKTKFRGLANVSRGLVPRRDSNRGEELVSRADQEGVAFRLRGGLVSPVSSRRSRGLMFESTSTRQFTHFFVFQRWLKRCSLRQVDSDWAAWVRSHTCDCIVLLLENL